MNDHCLINPIGFLGLSQINRRNKGLFLLFLYYFERCDEEDNFFKPPSQKEIAWRLDISRQTINKFHKVLLEYKVIFKANKGKLKGIRVNPYFAIKKAKMTPLLESCLVMLEVDKHYNFIFDKN
jgi:hypothetical protein